MRILPALAAGTLLLASSAAAVPAVAHGDGDRNQQVRAQLQAAGVDTPVMSGNVTLQSQQPGTAGISGCFTRTAPTFVASGLDQLSVYDVSDPASPQLTAKIPNALFENEAMTCGEKRTAQKSKVRVRRFVLIGIDLYNAGADPRGGAHTNEGEGQELMVVEVTNPASPAIRGTVKSTTGTHTVACVPSTNCRYAYSSGDDRRFSIFKIRKLSKPKEIDSNRNKEGIQPFRTPTGGHKWNFDNAGYGIHTGYDGSSMFDVSKPRRPKLITTTGAAGGLDPEQPGQDGYNDFIHHNSFRPNADAFRAGAEPAYSHGNVLLVTEEDYVQTDCSQAGSFQTWHVTKLRRGEGKAIKPLDKVELADLQEDQLAAGQPVVPQPQGTFCSAHWFDYHPSGIVAIGYYGGGTQFLDVRDPHDIKSFGYAYMGSSEVWDAMWVPVYGADGKQTGEKSNVVYSIDLIQGLNVFSVDLPGDKYDAEPSTGVSGGSLSDLVVSTAAPAGLVGGAMLLVLAVRRRARRAV